MRYKIKSKRKTSGWKYWGFINNPKIKIWCKSSLKIREFIGKLMMSLENCLFFYCFQCYHFWVIRGVKGRNWKIMANSSNILFNISLVICMELWFKTFKLNLWWKNWRDGVFQSKIEKNLYMPGKTDKNWRVYIFCTVCFAGSNDT